MPEIFAGRIAQLLVLFGCSLSLMIATESCDRTEGDVKEVSVVKAEAKELADVKMDGTYLAGLRWNDAKGTNVLVLTEERPDSANETLQELHARHFVLDKNTPRMVWEYRVKAENMCDQGQGLIAPPEVIDVNDDGLAEVIFVYNIQGNCDVAPKEYGLVMESRGQTFSIIGNDSLAVNNNLNGNGQKHFSEEFKAGDPKLRTYALGVWDRLVPKGDGK